jgi:hypothetical protein
MKEKNNVKDIFVFGHNDNDPPVLNHKDYKPIKFADEASLKQFFQADLFKKNAGHYIRTGKIKHPRIVVISWNGKAYGHLEIEKGAVPNGEKDLTKDVVGNQELVVNKTEWYEGPIDLTQLKIRNIHDDPIISHELFENIKNKAGKTTSYKL